jgi:dihydrofolate synthase / folylpolyglutamate synthase
MNFEDSVNYLYSLGHETLAMKLGLDTIRVLAAACGDPQRTFPAIHIAGTNGKGSTAAMTDAILRAAGFRVGLYTSPHLISIAERILFNGDQITQADFARLASEVRAQCDNLVAVGELEAPATFFEQVTMIAFLYFAERAIDIAVLEVGMGGRFDATNICQPVVTAITPIGYDHQKYLGETLAQIAGEKAGIIKPGVPVVVAPQAEAAMMTITARAIELHARAVSVDAMVRSPDNLLIDTAVDDYGPADISLVGRCRIRYRTGLAEYDVTLKLRGRHQVINALTAIHLAEQLMEKGWKISPAAIYDGLGSAEWPGRLELLQISQCVLLLDGAHNVEGARVLRDFLAEHFSTRPITLIFGAMADKSIDEMGGILFPIAQKIIVTRVDNLRAAEPRMLQAVAAKWQEDVICADDADQALDQALNVTPENGLICACGSLFLIGEILAISRRHKM